MVVTTNHASASSKQHGESHMSRTVACEFIRAKTFVEEQAIHISLLIALFAQIGLSAQNDLIPDCADKVIFRDKAIFHVGIVHLRG